MRRWRRAHAAPARTREDWARGAQQLLIAHHPDADRVVRVRDNLRAHAVASPYQAFAPQKAFALARRPDPPRPQHGSWLTIAEIGLSWLTQQCLGRRIATLDALNTELTAWTGEIDGDQRHVHRRFSAKDAPMKPRLPYPTL